MTCSCERNLSLSWAPHMVLVPYSSQTLNVSANTLGGTVSTFLCQSICMHIALFISILLTITMHR